MVVIGFALEVLLHCDFPSHVFLLLIMYCSLKRLPGFSSTYAHDLHYEIVILSCKRLCIHKNGELFTGR